MQIGRTGLRIESWCARKSRTAAVGASFAIAACSSREPAIADTLARICADSGRRGSVLVARPDDKDEESRVTFKLLGDGAGPGVVLCRDVLYADAAALLGLMGERATVVASEGSAIVDSTRTTIPAYMHDSTPYVAVAPFARHRRALLIPSEDHPMDATIWPRETLLHMKSLGGDQRAVYDRAVREGLVP